MKALDDYFKLQQEVFNYFGYVEDWVAIPLDDAREYVWRLEEKTNGGGKVLFADSREDLEDEEAGNYFSNRIYTQRFLPKWVYRGEEYTMICVDTQTDGNKFLRIFSNSLETN